MPRLPLPVRRIPSSAPSTKDPDVFANSLRKTLEAHRSTNRASLIRKVYPDAPSPGLFRPYIPPENRAGYQPPAPVLKIPETKKVINKEHRRNRARNSKLQSKDDREKKLRSKDDAPRQIICTADPSIYERLGQRPWLRYMPLSQATGDPFAFLDAEIQALGCYLAPSPEEQKQVTRISTEVASLLEGVVPYPPKLIGLHPTGLALAHASIEFILPFTDLPRSLGRTRMPSATRPEIREAHMELLLQVESALKSSGAFYGYGHVKNNILLKVCHRPTGLKLRFYCGEGVPAITKYLQDYMVEFPALRPLFLGTRTLLEARGFYGLVIENNALLMLLVAFLKMNHGRFTGPHTLGYQLMGFLKLYGIGVDLRSVGVAVDPPGFFDNEALRATDAEDHEPAWRRGQRSLMKTKRTALKQGNLPAAQRLCIQDPTHFMNNLGHTCIRTAELQSVFKTAYEQLSEACKTWDGPGQDDSILATALRASFDGFEERRRQITFRQRRPVNYV